jgi:hypothetical protein
MRQPAHGCNVRAKRLKHFILAFWFLRCLQPCCSCLVVLFVNRIGWRSQRLTCGKRVPFALLTRADQGGAQPRLAGACQSHRRQKISTTTKGGSDKTDLFFPCAHPLAGPRTSSAALASPHLATCPAACSARHRLVWLPSCLLWGTTWLRLAAARGTTRLVYPAPGSLRHWAVYPSHCTSGAGVPTRGTSYWGHPPRVKRHSLLGQYDKAASSNRAMGGNGWVVGGQWAGNGDCVRAIQTRLPALGPPPLEFC